jgi:N-methylhydantoinase B
VLSYIPPREIQTAGSLELDDAFDRELDPITYQVLRWRLWNTNLEHSDTIKRASGTPIVCFADDFNTSMTTENGDTIVGGPTIQYFIGVADLAVKWTLQYRGENPGIEEGDIFIQNDPYIAAPHQMDTAIYGPIYWRGKIFAWAFNNAHQADLGGMEPGSFCEDAKTIYDEPTPWPPTKLVRRGILQQDILQLFKRQSRMPEICELQLRAQIAGINTVRARMQEMLEEHGPAVLKGVMRRMIADCSKAVSKRLLQIPDGEWEQVTYAAGDTPAELVKVRMAVRKEGDQLTFTNAGTDPQFAGSKNCTYNSFRSAALCAMNSFFAWDQLWCPAGVANHLSFEPSPGTITTARFPSAVTVLYGIGICQAQAGLVLSKMLLCGPQDLRARANATGSFAALMALTRNGIDENDAPFTGMTADPMAGGFGAQLVRDGADHGAAYWWPRSNCGNVEEWEAVIPMIYLYHRQQRDSGGPGMHRGGNGMETALIGHKVRHFWNRAGGNHPAINVIQGLAGGLPGHSGVYAALENTKIRDVLAQGVLPGSRAALEAAVGAIPLLSPGEGLDLGVDGVSIVQHQGGGGMGDPLLRDPSAVLDDVRRGSVSVAHARNEYGVAISADSLDAESTSNLRANMRQQRLKAAAAPRMPYPGIATSEYSDAAGVVLGVAQARRVWACGHCGKGLAPATQDFRQGAAMAEIAPGEVCPDRYPDHRKYVPHQLVFRHWYCPSCATLLAVDSCRAEDPIAADARLASDRIESAQGEPVGTREGR